FQTAGIHAGLKRKRKDLGVIVCETVADAAAVYTLNQIQAAPITVTKETVKKANKIQAVIVNSGNANACTGNQGMQDANEKQKDNKYQEVMVNRGKANACTGNQGIEDAYEMQKVTADTFNVQQEHVAVASTGVIGEYLPMDKITTNIPNLHINNQIESATDFEEAILTTDTFLKSTCYETTIDGKTVTMAGAAKGSGMIEPNMGTMLGFITTDANISGEWLDKALKEAVDKTFNCITVDGDTSTNDMVIVLASGLQENEPLTDVHEDWST